jgi:hypothetical protein
MSTNSTSLKTNRRNPCAAARRKRGGTIINIITAVVFFGLIALGVLWVIKQTGKATQQYGEAMIDTSHKASALKCQMNMRSIYQNLQVYAMENEKYPSSQQELVDYCGDSRLFHCNEPNAPMYVYIPGQRGDMPPTNVLLYEPGPVHEGKCNVLFANGQTALLTPDELKQAIAATAATLRRGR